MVSSGFDDIPILTGPEHMAVGRRLQTEAREAHSTAQQAALAAQATSHFTAANAHATIMLARIVAEGGDSEGFCTTGTDYQRRSHCVPALTGRGRNLC
ncbi:hypothetical protein BJF83_20825 [Nocardiopsis sp. CNR-923]|uniref:hypothetical protein n=1 Tax=Nocardiopsis sp. CNR-923 TaxID=1904965 RepID=UPI00095A8D22|nr:hypothetical protein [Nocardiopsis sp. CNR-923]OLT26532.1 hypothetical protein BJF83_20825 [Nocardiopsis sp. CNR-923]